MGSILLSWGKNFMPFTDFFIDHVPMYAKFRTVASILVIAEFTIPLLAMLGLKRIVEEPNLLKTRKFYISMGVTAGICLLFALVPTLFFPDFVSQAEREALSQLPQEYCFYSGLLALVLDYRRGRGYSFALQSQETFRAIHGGSVGRALSGRHVAGEQALSS